MNQFEMIDRHMYFGDSVIRFNYDLMKNGDDCSLNDVALVLKNVLGLKSEEIVNSCIPKDSHKFNRLLYVV